MASSLPTVPAGANPFEVYLGALESGFYNAPSPGFRARCYVLWAVTFFAVFAALAYSTLLVVDYDRRGRSWWLWRTVKRPAGRFIVLNQHALTSFLSIFTALALFGHIYTEYDLFINRASPDISLLYRIWVWIPLWLQGYLVSFASLQAYVVTSEGVGDGKHTLSARTLNGVFLSVGGAVVAELIVVCALCTSAWQKFFGDYQQVRAVLEQGAASWNAGSQDASLLAQVLPLYGQMIESYKPFFATQQAVTWSLVVAPFLLVILNFGGLRLICTLRKQIEYNKSRRGTETTKQTVSTASSALSAPTSPLPQIGSPSLSMRFEGETFDPLESRQSDVPSTTGFSTFAPTSSGHTHLVGSKSAPKKQSEREIQRENTLFALQRAETELITVCSCVVFLGLVFGAISIWTAVAALSIVISWNALETTVFFVPWAWSVVVAVTLTALSWNVTRSLKHGPRREQTTTAHSSRDTGAKTLAKVPETAHEGSSTSSVVDEKGTLERAATLEIDSKATQYAGVRSDVEAAQAPSIPMLELGDSSTEAYYNAQRRQWQAFNS